MIAIASLIILVCIGVTILLAPEWCILHVENTIVRTRSWYHNR